MYLTRNIIAFVALCCLSGCSYKVYNYYDGPVRPASEVAIVLESIHYTKTRIASVNKKIISKPFWFAHRQYRFLPGYYDFDIEWMDPHTKVKGRGICSYMLKKGNMYSIAVGKKGVGDFSGDILNPSLYEPIILEEGTFEGYIYKHFPEEYFREKRKRNKQGQ